MYFKKSFEPHQVVIVILIKTCFLKLISFSAVKKNILEIIDCVQK